MPTYEYICEKCGHHFEQVQPMSAKPLTICPEALCAQKPWRKGKVKRAISGGAGVIFKGSGFYVNDYRSEKYKEAARKDAAAVSSTSTKTATNSTGKSTAAKSESPASQAPPAKD
jgi:putative FmdB family regulatory protein